MTEPSSEELKTEDLPAEELQPEELQALTQAYLNCLELCRAFKKRTDDPYVREALGTLIDDLQEPLAALGSQLRRQGLAPGALELDRLGKARIREILGTRSLREQLLAVRRCLADLVAWHTAHSPAAKTGQIPPDWLGSLSAQAQQMLDNWDQHMAEMKAHVQN